MLKDHAFSPKQMKFYKLQNWKVSSIALFLHLAYMLKLPSHWFSL